VIRVTSIATLTNGKYTAFTFDTSKTTISSLTCTIQLVDDAQNTLILAKQTTQGDSDDLSPASRRLLQSGNNDATFQWTATGKLEWTYTANKPNSAGTLSVSLAVLVCTMLLTALFA